MKSPTDLAYLHGECNQDEVESSYKKYYNSTSITSNSDPFESGLTVSKEKDVVLESRKCRNCPGCFFIGKTQWFKVPNRNPIIVFWSPEGRRLREFAKFNSSNVDRQTLNLWRAYYHLQRVVLRYIFEDIKRARRVLDPDTMSVILQECYFNPKESWQINKPYDDAELEYESNEDRIRCAINNLKRNYELCQFLIEVIGQSKFF